MPKLRTLLLLGRVSNLPTVWSNCLAGWWLGGAGNVAALPFLIAGVTSLYLGGMFLNDAFDADFDRQHRKERPIPAGAIPVQAVWRWGLSLLAGGTALLFLADSVSGVFGLLLVGSIISYDAIHKVVTFSPILMGLCRFWVYVVAAATGAMGVTGWAIWSGLALAVYVAGLSLLARRESARGPVSYWPLIPLATPLLLAVLMNGGGHRSSALLLSLVLAIWIVRCARSAYWRAAVNLRRTVSGLLAGIVFVDWLAVAHAPREMGIAFIALFVIAVILQRFVPAS